MTPLGISPPEYAPIFDWAAPRSRRAALSAFIAGSALLHALCFYIFQIIYPPTVALLPPPARVSLITAGSEEGRVLLRWIDAEDPALPSTTVRPPGNESLALPRLAHIPSYLRHQPALKELPPHQPDLRVPSSQPPAPVSLPRAAPESTPPVVATMVAFSDGMEQLGTPVLPPFRFSASSKESPQAARFRVGVGTRGDVRHCLLENSSGDPALDAQVRHYLALCRFPAIENRKPNSPLLWRTALVEWGNDITPAAPAATPSPPP